MTGSEIPPTEQGEIELGIPGFDDALGKLPRGFVLCVLGGPGVGKTVFGIQAACHAASQGRKVLYVTVAQDSLSLKRQAASLGRDLSKLEQSGFLKIHHIPAPVDASESQQTLVDLKYEVESLSPDILIIDGAAALARELTSSALIGMVGRGIFQVVRDRGILLIALLDEGILEQNFDLKQCAMKNSDVVLWFGWRSVGKLRVRSARVLKARGIDVKRPEWGFAISGVSGGIGTLFIPDSLDHVPRREGFLSTGLPGLDEFLGGGIPKGSLTLILGPTGAGKAELASAIAANLANRGRRVLILSFELVKSDVEALVEEFGLRPDRSSYIDIHSLEPQVIDTIDQLTGVMKRIIEFRPEVIVTLGYASLEMWLGLDVALYLMRHMQCMAKVRDLTTLVTARAQDPEEHAETYAHYADLILSLRRQEREGVKRVITVLKSRNPELEGRSGLLEIKRGSIRVIPR